MKKIVKYLILTFLFSIATMFCLHMTGQALEPVYYNGSSHQSGSRPTGLSCNPTYQLCNQSIVPYKYGLRVSFVYYDGSSYTQIGDSLDIWGGTISEIGVLRFTPSTQNSKINPNEIFTVYTGEGGTGYKYEVNANLIAGIGSESYSQKLTKYFLTKERMDEYSQFLVGCKVSDKNAECYKNIWGKENQVSDPTGAKPATKGYRFFIEPLYPYISNHNNEHGFKDLYIFSLTEYARWGKRWKGVDGQQFIENQYLQRHDILTTDYKDIGISPVVGCKALPRCGFEEVANQQKGHALQIIDFSEFLDPPACNYETGEGFPKDKNRGDELTEQEEKCCEEKLQEIKDKYKGKKQTPEQCMLVSDSIPSFVNCMNVYFQSNASNVRLWEEEKKELLEFDQKYPACSNVGCEFQPLLEIEERYHQCLTEYDLITWMNKILLCEDTTCEIQYKKELYMYKDKYQLCDIEEWEKKIPTYHCTVLTPDCDENNPNHFPKSCNDKNPDMTCCVYFEEQMKLEYERQGLSPSEINQKIIEWFNEPGKEFRQNCLCKSCKIDDPAPFTEYCCKELMEAYPEKPDSFWFEKGCKSEEKNKCTWNDYTDQLIEHLKNMMSANCSVGTNTKLEANDTDDWDCIFDSDNILSGTKEEVFKDYYVKYSNPYCAVYCREDIKYDFPNGSMIVKAGNHFTVGETGHAPEWKNVQFSSTRQCQTNGSTYYKESEKINTEQFEKDWKKANDKVISTWDDWKIAQQKDWSYAHSRSSGVKDCDYRCVGWCMSCNKKGECHSYCCETRPFGYTMYPATVYYASFEKSERNVTPGTWCSTKGHPDPGSERKGKIHETAKQEMETIETDIHACTSWNEFDSYRYANFSRDNVKAYRYEKYSSYKDFLDYKEFSPDLTINYDEYSHDEYDYNNLLKKEEKDTVISDNNFSTTGKQFTIKYKCPPTVAPNHQTCEKVVVFDYSPQKEAHSTYYKEIKYTLQDGVFNTILKPQGIAVNGSQVGSNSKQIYIDLGYSALHVHFMTPTGRYYIGLTYPGFTPALKPNQFEHNFDKLFDHLTNDSYKYDCTYTVDNEIIENDDPNCVGDNCFPCKSDNCDPASLKGLNLIYRPISLGEPFPGINGEGRTPGSNWNDASLIEKFITKNRGVNANKIYTKAPMYQITLTPALIQKIRKYNESTTYNDFNMDCISGGKECKSYFIRGNLEDSSYDFSGYFRTCKAEGNRGSGTCCGIGNWNDCDNQDGITRR